METTFLKGLVKASIFGTLLLPTISTAQQDTLKISKELSEEWKKMYPRINTVAIYKIEDENREAYFLNRRLEQSDEFYGTYVKFPQSYKFARSGENGKYYANELVDNAKEYKSYYLSEMNYTIIKDDNDSLYTIPEEDLKKLDLIKSRKELTSVVNKLGYKEYRDGEDLYIKSKTAEIKLDARTYSELKKNPNYIATLDADQAKIAALVKQTIPHSKTLDKYLSQHRIQKSNLPTATINTWRTATTNAQKLLDQINKLSEKYDGNYSFTLLNKSSTFDIFLDNVLASKGVLGM